MVKKANSPASILKNMMLSPEEVKNKLNSLSTSFNIDVGDWKPTQRDGFVTYWEYISKLAEKEHNKASEAEIRMLEYANEYLNLRLSELAWYIQKIDDDSFRDAASDCAFSIWVHAIPKLTDADLSSPNVLRYFRARQAHAARVKNSVRPERQALHAAIEEELAGRIVSQPYKEADAMLDAVNARLAKEGYRAVKRDAVARRLKTKAQSSKPRKKARTKSAHS